MTQDIAGEAREDEAREGEKHGLVVVGIGASAGGLAATKTFFEHSSDASGMAYVVVMHLSEDYESHLDDILQTATRMPVIQVTEAVQLEANHVYVIPPGKQLVMDGSTLRLLEPERVRGRRVLIDLFFRTLAEVYGSNAVAVVLSGTGSDGTLGLARVKENGGFTVAQDPQDAEYDSMPRSAIATGLVDLVLPVGEIPQKLERMVWLSKQAAKPPLRPPLERSTPARAPEQGDDFGVWAESLHDVLALVKVRTGHDFSQYKLPTVRRRISRRLQVHELTDLNAYLELLRTQPEEVSHLLRDLLITVTNFFRDPPAWAALESEVVPSLFEGKTSSDSVRVWVVGSATGEEAYSVGMLLLEHTSTLSDPPKLQIFASDINEAAIRIAREGRFDEASSLDLTPERLSRFFVKDGNAYRVKKELREIVLFAPHDVLRDPPFSKLDLVTCRNLLIYFNRPTQERVMEIFHFALLPGGFLFLGSSESAESSSALFTPLNKKQLLFRARAPLLKPRFAAPPPLPDSAQSDSAQPNSAQAMPGQLGRGEWFPNLPELPRSQRARRASLGDLHYQLLERLAPPSILIDEHYQILHASENAARFLRFSGGEPSHNLLKVALPGLSLDLRATLIAAQRTGRTAEARHVSVDFDGFERFVNLAVRQAAEDGGGLLLVTFDEIDEINERDDKVERAAEALEQVPGHPSSVSDTLRADRALESMVQRLEEEAQAARNLLQATVEQCETSTEELKASFEELQAINEELRSASEELETSKEELQSLNEELITVNQELGQNVDKVNRVNSDLQNLISATDIGTLFLDRALCIKRYTPRVLDLFNLIGSDVGRPLSHVTHHLDYDGLIADAQEVLQTLNSRTLEIGSTQGSGRYQVRLTPYRTLDNFIDGVVVSFVDVTERKRAEDTLREADQRKDEFLATLSHELRNPLNALASSLNLMRRLESLPEVQAVREAAEGPLEMMRRLIDDLLDVGRISQGKIRLRLALIQLSSVLHQAAQTLRPRFTEAGRELIIDVPETLGTLEGDAVRLEQVFTNLLSNAVKYSDAGGCVWVSAARVGAEAVVRVRDNGIGISSEGIVGVFEKFSQIPPQGGRPQDGLGIGLYLVRRIVEQHGGSVTAHSDGLNLGSEFTVRLPLSAPEGALERPRLPKQEPWLESDTVLEPATVAVLPNVSSVDSRVDALNPSPNPSSGPHRWRILLADDYEPARKVIARLLKYLGHEVAVAVDGPNTLEVASSFQPELILLDINMPGLSGYQVARALRAQPQFGATVLIALTGYGQPEDVQRAREAGFNGHLVKPLESNVLERLLEGRSWPWLNAEPSL